jgi:ActR/RegA family two-component response regulator
VYASAGILIFGHDAILLETRRLILEKAGFQVWIADEANEAVQVLVREPIDLFILCQSLSHDECLPILETAHTLRPDMKNLILGGETRGLSADRDDTFLTTFLEPRALISFIQNKISAKAVAQSLQ